MSKKIQYLELGNFVCKFGEKAVLLDLFNEVIAPALLNKSPYIRQYGDTRYFLHKPKLVKLTDPNFDNCLAVVGRFVKDTILEREQIYTGTGDLVPDSKKLQSAPSSFFVLVLHNHRLLYVKENIGAPSMEQFGLSMQAMFRARHAKFIQEEQRKRKQKKDSRIKKYEILEDYPYPSVSIVPLTSTDGMKKFIEKFQKVDTLQVRFSDRNHEQDNDPFFKELQNRKDSLKSTSSMIIHRNAEGLNKTAVKKEIADATAQGNQLIKITGVDKEGDKIQGINEDFKIRHPLSIRLGTNPDTIASRLYNAFLNITNTGIITIPAITKDIVKKLNQIKQ